MSLAAVQTSAVERLALTREELATALGKGKKKVDLSVSSLEIPSFLWGRTRLFRVEDVKAWMASRVVADMAEKTRETADQLVLRAIAANPALAAQVMAAVEELRAVPPAGPAAPAAEPHLQLVRGT